MTALAKRFTDPQILSIMKLERLGTDVYVINSSNHWPQRHYDKKSDHRNPARTIGHCDVTIAIGRLMCRWRHDRSTFWNHREHWRDKMLMSLKAHESHKLSVHRIHGSKEIADIFHIYNSDKNRYTWVKRYLWYDEGATFPLVYICIYVLPQRRGKTYINMFYLNVHHCLKS